MTGTSIEGLELSGINTFYGRSHVLHDVSLTVRPGELVFLLGRNGAGKSTTMNSAVGLLKPRSGTVTLDGQDLRSLKPSQIVKQGLALVPEERRLFAQMTVRENLQIAERHARRGSQWSLDSILGVLPVVGEFMDRPAGRLSGGEQQMVAIARALMSNPRILLLDEPMEGLAPLVIRALEGHMEKLREAGVGLLITEAQLERVLQLEGRAYVIDRGSVVMEATTAELARERDVVQRHLTV